MFIEKLEEILKEKNLTFNKLAKETGIKQQTMSSWKEGRYPGIDKLKILAQYLEVPTDFLLEMQPTEPDILTPKEKLLIEYFRQVEDDTGKDFIIEVAKREASRAAPKKSPPEEKGSLLNSKIG